MSILPSAFQEPAIHEPTADGVPPEQPVVSPSPDGPSPDVAAVHTIPHAVPDERDRKKRRLWQAADLEAQHLLRRLRISLLLFGLVIIYGTAGYRLIERMGTLDALYMTIITVFTVGFGEINGPLSEPGRLFTITLIVGGTGVSLYTLGLAFELLISEQFSYWRQRQKMHDTIDKLKDHYVICGYGRIGKQVAADLRDAGVPFLVVENNPDRCAVLLDRGILFVQGDATLDEVLLEAGIERARGMVGALNKDADNMMAVVSARGLNTQLFIIVRTALPEAEKKLKRAGADEVISPYIVGARRMSLSILRPAVSGFLNAVIYDRQLQAEFNEIVIPGDSPLVGQTLTEAGMAHDLDVLPIALLRHGKLIVSPLPDTILQGHDTLIVVTQVDSLSFPHK
ncbi:MAG: potassium channel protein [Armatimonadota bacterium]|nr:potassium channel protein [Armatimonadota bacterium]